MAINPDEDTEFNDALRKHGILPPKPEAPRTPSPPPSPTLDELLEGFTPSELRERAEDTRDEDEARAIEAFRRRRLEEMQRETLRARFGRVYPIGRDDYTREVTEASKVDEVGEEMQGRGTGVVCLLYKDGHDPSSRTYAHMHTLAARHPRTKFVSIVGDKCIPNYPDKHLPTLFIYRNGQIANQQMAWGADRERSLEELEALLILTGAIVPSDGPLPSNERDRDDDEDEADDTRTRRAGLSSGAQRNIRNAAVDDDDSDFDI